MLHVLTLQGHTARANQFVGCHWRTVHSMKKRDRVWVECASHSQGTQKAQGKRRVSLIITMAPRQRCPDRDAFWKSLLDALVCAGLLVDDSPGWCEQGQVEYQRGEKAKMEVVLEDC